RPSSAIAPDVHPPDGLDLDDLPLAADPEDVPALASNLDWDGNRPWGQPIVHVAPPDVFGHVERLIRRTPLRPLARFVAVLTAFVHAARLLWASRRPETVVL